MEANRVNALVAERICGWIPIPEEEDGWTNGKQKRWPSPPDYTSDRNAVAEMEEAIEQAGKQREYMIRLFEVLKPQFFEDWQIRRATPAQCVEAALRAYGLWEEG